MRGFTTASVTRLDRAHVRVDLDDLDQLLTTASDDGDDPAALETALALWRGEPLEGSDFLWAEGERRNLHATLVDLLERVGRTRLARGDARAALQLAEQAIGLRSCTSQAGGWRCKPNTPSACASRSPAATTSLPGPLTSSLGLSPRGRRGSSTGSCSGRHENAQVATPVPTVAIPVAGRQPDIPCRERTP